MKFFKFFNEVMGEFRRFLHQAIVLAFSPHTKYVFKLENYDIFPTDPMDFNEATARQMGGTFPKVVLPSPHFDRIALPVIIVFLLWRFPNIGIFDLALYCFAFWRLKSFVQHLGIKFCVAYDITKNGSSLGKPEYGEILAADSEDIVIERPDGTFIRTTPPSIHSIISREEYEASNVIDF